MKSSISLVEAYNSMEIKVSRNDTSTWRGLFLDNLIFRHIPLRTITSLQRFPHRWSGVLRQLTIAVLIVLTLLLPLCATAQEVTKERTFEGDALYGFINGGSDLFFEYGFRKLTVRELTFEGFRYTMEIYRMSTPQNAFGIYSIHVFKPLRVDYLVPDGFDCLSKYQLQAAVKDEYISIVFNDGEKAAGGAEKLLGQYLRWKNDMAKGDAAGCDTTCAACISSNSQDNATALATNGTTDTTSSCAKGNTTTLATNGTCHKQMASSIFPPEIQKLPHPFTGRLRYIAGEISLSQAADDVCDQYPAIGTGYTLWSYTHEDGTTTYLTSPK